MILASGVLLALLAGGPAAAAPIVPSKPVGMEAGPASLEDHVRDLASERRADRLLAARELRALARSAWRRSAPERAASLAHDEALVELDDLRLLVVDPARRAIREHAELRRPCADLLRYLGDPAALPELRAALDQEARPAVRERLQESIEALSGGSP